LDAARIELTGDDGTEILVLGDPGVPHPRASMQNLRISGRANKGNSVAVYVGCGALSLARADIEALYGDGLRVLAGTASVSDLVITTSSGGRSLHAVLKTTIDDCPDTSIRGSSFHFTSALDPLCDGTSQHCGVDQHGFPTKDTREITHGGGELTSDMACTLLVP
jgi:hypothetical protein